MGDADTIVARPNQIQVAGGKYALTEARNPTELSEWIVLKGVPQSRCPENNGL